ncbi:UDP-GalNAc:beta-1,3-N-acetylgalactosaminyltransferase 2-like [Lineus longissimus]|uniref:UDP-GalNAc:beta-1, 3-N-acetylgalactosaminyltransferase 2-like n=1 Tax=Lineus longissimus TaxID=88925 RepID=UPI00315CCE15
MQSHYLPCSLLRNYETFIPFSRFRYYWSLDTTGKWRETKYEAATYPPFACGSGYVVSGDVVQWLAKNAEYLTHYQGEDVSMGIWLAAVHPDKIDDDLWLCEKKCGPGSLSLPELSFYELNRTWQNKMKCGNPCGCV